MPKRRERASNTGPVSIERIEQEAIRLFSERTYSVVGMRDIGDAVGLLPGSLYVHITSKEELLLRIVEQGIRNYLDAIEKAADSGQPAPTRLREAIVAHFVVLSETLEQTRVAFQQWTYLSEEKRAQIAELRVRYEGAFTRIVHEGITAQEFREPADLRVSVLTLIGTLTAATNWYAPDGRMSPQEIGGAVADQLLGGLALPPRRASRAR